VITFDNVVFNYPSQPNVPVLRGLSLTFQPGIQPPLSALQVRASRP
jgi:ABC-type multidrug transport system fused ATPase/permease subunit